MTQIERLREWHKAQLGTTEYPAGSNNVRYNTAYYGRAVSGKDYPWCVAYQWCAYRETGLSALFYGGGKTASCGTLMTWAKSRGQWVTGDYKPGDLALFDFTGKRGKPTHIGWIDRVNGAMCWTYEGNTSRDSDDNGGAVMYRTRQTRYITGAVRPLYAEEDDMDITKLTDAEVVTLLKRALRLLSDEEIYNLVQRANAHAGQQDAPDWAVDEYGEAIAAGVTDGTRPQATVTRLEAALMAYRAGKTKKN